MEARGHYTRMQLTFRFHWEWLAPSDMLDSRKCYTYTLKQWYIYLSTSNSITAGWSPPREVSLRPCAVYVMKYRDF